MLTRRVRKLCNQDVVYWPPAGEDAHGQPTYGSPVQFECRWEDMNEQFLDRNNNVALSKAKIYTYYDPDPAAETNSVVIKELGVVCKGTVGTVQAAPFDNPTAFEVRRADGDPDKKGVEFVYTIYL